MLGKEVEGSEASGHVGMCSGWGTQSSLGEVDLGPPSDQDLHPASTSLRFLHPHTQTEAGVAGHEPLGSWAQAPGCPKLRLKMFPPVEQLATRASSRWEGPGSQAGPSVWLGRQLAGMYPRSSHLHLPPWGSRLQPQAPTSLLPCRLHLQP